MDWFRLMQMGQPDIAARFPLTRRFFANGFTIDPRHHENDIIGLTSPNQTIRLNLLTGDFEPVARPLSS